MLYGYDFLPELDAGAENGTRRQLNDVARSDFRSVGSPRFEIPTDIDDDKIFVQIQQIDREPDEEHVHAVSARPHELEEKRGATGKTAPEHETSKATPECVSYLDLTRQKFARRSNDQTHSLTSPYT